MKSNEKPATFRESRAEALKYTGRGYATLRHVVVQHPPEAEHRASTLGRLVHAREHRALLLYLLLLTLWPFLEERRTPLPGRVWARLLSPTGSGRHWTPSEVSDAWGRLEKAKLVGREREGRALRVWPLREDGTGALWTRPSGEKGNLDEAYFVLPGTFWLDDHFAILSLPGLAVLLILLKETSDKKEVWINSDRAKEWYGISTTTWQKGVRELEKLQLLQRNPQVIKSGLSPTGATTRWWYALTDSYSYAAREAAKRKARKETNARTAKTAPPAKSTASDTASAPAGRRSPARKGTTSASRARSTRSTESTGRSAAATSRNRRRTPSTTRTTTTEPT